MLLRPLRLALITLVVFLAVPAASVQAGSSGSSVSSASSARSAARMPIGFFDDASFRWAEDPAVNLAQARRAGASIIHVLADWSQIASRRPAAPLNGDDPAYKLSDLDTIVETAPRYNLQILMTISGTPKWANGGKTPNVAPTSLQDLTNFARMLAARYNGLRLGFAAVSRWSVWNEPNLEQFLKPQFDGNEIVSPKIYAKLYMAAYRGIKAGNPLAEVAAGETSNRGRNKPLRGVSGSVAPATFARLLSQAAPRLPFAAWATHPYPTMAKLGPKQKVAYPNVSLGTMQKFGDDLQKWFKRRVPIWVTEYAEQTRPESFLGVPKPVQAAHAKLALQLAAANPYVEMFIWFVLRDSTDRTWHSGLIAKNGTKKPSFAAFASVAKQIDGQTQIVTPGKNPTVRVDVPYLTWYDRAGAPVGVIYKVYDGKKLIATAHPRSRLDPDQTVSFVVRFRPVNGKSYRLTADVGDRNGQHSTRVVMLVATA